MQPMRRKLSVSQPANLKHHVKDIHIGRIFVCKTCDQRISGYFKLHRHKQQCARSFEIIYEPKVDTETTKTHKTILSRGDRLNCNQCDQTFSVSQPNNLRTHIKDIHMGRIFICKTCYHRISGYYSMHRHRKQCGSFFDIIYEKPKMDQNQSATGESGERKNKISQEPEQDNGEQVEQSSDNRCVLWRTARVLVFESSFKWHTILFLMLF